LDRISFYSGNYGTDSFLGSGFELGFSSGFADQIIPVPEPETYLTGVILLLGIGIYLRRQAKHRGHRPAWPKFLHGIRPTTPGHHPAQKLPDPHPARRYS
jgi:hypothetical protein